MFRSIKYNWGGIKDIHNSIYIFFFTMESLKEGENMYYVWRRNVWEEKEWPVSIEWGGQWKDTGEYPTIDGSENGSGEE